jgi:hypothetical protein
LLNRIRLFLLPRTINILTFSYAISLPFFYHWCPTTGGSPPPNANHHHPKNGGDCSGGRGRLATIRILIAILAEKLKLEFDIRPLSLGQASCNRLLDSSFSSSQSPTNVNKCVCHWVKGLVPFLRKFSTADRASNVSVGSSGLIKTYFSPPRPSSIA